ncbi:hypothetical protein OBBRIDRAFT_216903 [Obba rivulosa]|uniref:Uncharacterized protein n=1 Tax=Obba rivulosa TaxID=1052685 RepID=A0A8E2DQT5_9APHY|nr:hypothetical protein OBBRIDRAFT_216903 [Obba rivulosa]
MEEATKAVIKVVVALHPAFTILQSAFEYYDRVKYSKARCRSLLQRAERILRTIGELMKENRCSSSAHDLERLRRNFKCIQQTIKTHSHMSFLKSLLRLDDINTALDEGHRYLDDCLTCFQVTRACINTLHTYLSSAIDSHERRFAEKSAKLPRRYRIYQETMC